MSRLLVTFIGLLGSFLLWAVVYLAVKRSVFTMKSILNVLHVLHYFFVIVGAVLMIGFFEQPPARFGWGALVFSFGLIWPEQWLKRQMSPPPTSPVTGKLI